MTSIPSSAVDGRSLRRERNRQDIVDALLGLIENGETEISAALIASKAGLSERSIFRYFDDVNDLYRSVCDLAFSKEIEYALIDDAGVGRKLLRTQIIKHFAEELSAFDKQQQQAAVAIIDSLTTFESYDMMRSDQRMSVQAIKSILTESIRKALQ